MAKKISCFFFLFGFSILSAQEEILRLEQAVGLALEQNHNLKIAKSKERQSENNASMMNIEKLLPSVQLTAYTRKNIQDINQEFAGGGFPPIVINDAATLAHGGAVNVNLLIFNGLGRYFSYQKNKKDYEVNQIQTQRQIETTLLSIFKDYYALVESTQTLQIAEETLKVSTLRYDRARVGYQYGTHTELDVLNAKIDVATDSINLIDVRNQQKNSKRSLNLLLGRDLEIDYKVDTAIYFMEMVSFDDLQKQAEASNLQLEEARKKIASSRYNYKNSYSVFAPRIDLQLQYADDRNTSEGGFVASSHQLGNMINLTARWDIFDSRGLVAIKNAKIAIDIEEETYALIKQMQARDLLNTYSNYERLLLAMQVEEENVVTNIRNFSRSKEMYFLGQMNSVEFRMAQINLLNAKKRLYKSRHLAKIEEMNLLSLTGSLVKGYSGFRPVQLLNEVSDSYDQGILRAQNLAL